MKYEEAIQYIRNVSKMMKNIILNSSSWAEKKNVGTKYHACIKACKAMEKQIPEKGILIGDNYSSVLSCPNCRMPIVNVWNSNKYNPNYCHYCGQKLLWEE